MKHNTTGIEAEALAFARRLTPPRLPEAEVAALGLYDVRAFVRTGEIRPTLEAKALTTPIVTYRDTGAVSAEWTLLHGFVLKTGARGPVDGWAA